MRRLLLFTTVAVAALSLPTIADAAIVGTVYLDYNSNGAKNAGGYVTGTSASVTATDSGVGGVLVTAYDASGREIARTTTGADGTYTLATSGSATVRVQFTPPSGYAPSFQGANDGTSVQFVAANASGVDFGVGKATLYCQDNPKLVTCQQPIRDSMLANPTFPGARVVPTALNRTPELAKNGQFTRSTASTQTTTFAQGADLGAVFGVGVDRQRNVFYGTYVKRHSPYGPGSDGTNGAANWIYRVNLDKPGTVAPFVRLGINTLPAHSAAAPAAFGPLLGEPGLAYAADGNRDLTPGQQGYSNVYSMVGRAGLGDVDVTPDGSTLLAVEMTESDPKLWSVPLSGSGNSVIAGTPTAYPIPAPTGFGGSTCVGTWHPMAIGTRESEILVGGVCGAEATATTGSSTTNVVAFVMRFDSATGSFTTIAALPMNYWRAAMNWSQMETFVQAGDLNNATGMWHNWNDSAPPVSSNGRLFWAKPMLANIEIGDGGELTLAFRDRFLDQENAAKTVMYDSPLSTSPWYADFGTAAGDLIRMCQSDGAYVMENNGTCGGVGGARQPGLLIQDPSKRPHSALFFFSGWAIWHAYTNQGGLAHMPGTKYYWSTNWDIDDYYQQGILAFGPCADRQTDKAACGPVPAGGADEGSIIGGIAFGLGGSWYNDYRPPSSNGEGSGAFLKGNGLGDLEIVCDAAPVQIGNRVWIDANRDGIQDPGEPAVAGVTVHLYDASGTLAGTAITDANGDYYFSSNVTAPAAGDGSSAGGGLAPGAAFTIKLDKPSDYAAGGPLAGYVLTTADATSPDNAANSKAKTVDGYPTIEIPARSAGQNNHTFDFGFHVADATVSLVAVGNYTWVDVNEDGRQGERPLRGVKVTLLTATGKRARNAAGKLVPIKTTNAKGRYVFDGLAPGRYRVQFLLPAGYRFTAAGKATAKSNSDPRSVNGNPLLGITPVFKVYAAVKGNTIRNRNAKVNATFIDPTIDAGVVRLAPVPTPSNVTG